MVVAKVYIYICRVVHNCYHQWNILERVYDHAHRRVVGSPTLYQSKGQTL